MSKHRAYFGLAFLLFVIAVILIRVGFDMATVTTTSSGTYTIGFFYFNYTNINIHPAVWAYIGYAVFLLSVGVFFFAIYQFKKQKRS